MEKKQYYYIECTFDENGKTWQRWSEEKFLSFSKINNEVSKLSRQELEFNSTENTSTLVLKIYGFRIVLETLEVHTQIVSECLLV